MPDRNKFGEMPLASGLKADALVWVPDEIHTKYPDGFVIRVEVEFVMLRHGDKLLVTPAPEHRSMGAIVAIYHKPDSAPELSILTDETLADNEFKKVLADAHLVASAFGFSRNGIWHSLRPEDASNDAIRH